MRIIRSIESLLNLPGKNIAFFGGSFDPPHFGHLDFIRKACSIINLNHVIICPNSKDEDANVSEIKHRLRMMDMLFETPEMSQIYVLSKEVCINIQQQIFIDDIFHLLMRRGKNIYVLVGCDSIELCTDFFKIPDVTLVIGCGVVRSEAEEKLLNKNMNRIFIEDIIPCSSSNVQMSTKVQSNYLNQQMIDYIESNQLYWHTNSENN